MRLWHKLAAAGLLLLGTVLLVVYLAASQLLAATVIQQFQARGQELARPLSAALVAPLLQQDYATVQAVLDDVTAVGHLKALRLTDVRGQRIAVSGGSGSSPPPPLATPYTDRRGGLCMDFEAALTASGQPLGTLRFVLSAQALGDSLDLLHRQAVAIGVLALLVLGLLVVWGSQRLAAPLQRLSSVAQQMQHGQYDAVLPRVTTQEFAQLSASLAALRDTIRERITQLDQLREVAEAANQAKSSFLANTSHELRTPLNGVLGMARLARDPALDPTRRQRYLDLLADSAKHLADILSDTLDLARIEAGKLVLDLQAFDPRALMQTTVANHRPLVDNAGRAITLEVAPEVPGLVLGDAVRVRQILAKYLSNALKFSEQGTVQVQLRRAGADRLRLSVTDHGAGLAPEVQAQLFKPFTQADASATRRHGGSGLGLAICRELALHMDGQVGVCSQPGQGACFWAELRLPTVAHAAGTEPPPSPAQLARLRGQRALVVEDNPVNRLLAVTLLESWGLQVLQAEDGQQALDAVARARQQGQPVQLVLMDLQMPVMDGHQATCALRRLYSPAQLPIVALTAAALTSERDHALAEGMNDFLTKPVDPARLQATLVQQLTPAPGADLRAAPTPRPRT